MRTHFQLLRWALSFRWDYFLTVLAHFWCSEVFSVIFSSMRRSRQSSPEYSLWLKIPPTVNKKKICPLLNLVPKTVSVIAFRIVLTLVVKIVSFGCQVTVYFNKQHKSALFGCSWIQKLKCDGLLHRLLICSTEKGNLFNFVCPLGTLSFIRISGT